MAISLLQSGRGSSVSATGTVPFTVGTATYTLPQATQAGSLLIIHHAGTAHSHTAGQFEGPSAAISIPGLGSFSSPAGNQWKEGTNTTGGIADIDYLANAASVPMGTVVSVTFSMPGSGVTYDVTGEFYFYEFAGVVTSSPVEVAHSFNSPNTGVPTQNNLTTVNTDLIMVGYAGSDSNAAAGSGYTIGSSMLVSVYSEVQYILNQSPGTFTTSFGSGSQTHFGGFAVAFKAAAVTANSSYGFFFG